MRRRGPRKLGLTILAASLVFLCVAAWAANDPQTGVWKLDKAKSNYSGPVPQSQTWIIEPYGTDGIKFYMEMIGASGEKTVAQFSASFDGKKYQFVRTGAGVVSGEETVSIKRIDSHTMDRTYYVAGKEAERGRWVISKDGKTRTVTESGTNAQGQTFRNVIVCDRQ